MTKPGALVISLDFELIWGVFDKVIIDEKKTYFQNTRKIIPSLLNLFETYQVNTTWACVGMLFNKSAEEWLANQPEILPQYKLKKLSAYDFFKQNKDSLENYFCFAPKLIHQIKATAGQEIATHTYSHYYCLEKGQDGTSFEADLNMAVELARNQNVELKSLVFPRNQFNEEYLRICANLGITSVRTNPSNWYWRDTQKDTVSQKVFRTGDAYLGLKDKAYKWENISIQNKELPLQQPASRLLRPFSGNFLNSFKLNRINLEIEHAAKNGLIYHLWWHPHNFGNFPQENIKDLEMILQTFDNCRNKYGMQSFSMWDITKELENTQI